MAIDRQTNGGIGSSRVARESWDQAGQEPRLADLLSDPLLHLLMGRDRLVLADVEAAIALARSALRRRLCSAGDFCCAV